MGTPMWRFVLTVLIGTALLSAAGLVLALQCVRLIEKIEGSAVTSPSNRQSPAPEGSAPRAPPQRVHSFVRGVLSRRDHNPKDPPRRSSPQSAGRVEGFMLRIIGIAAVLSLAVFSPVVGTWAAEIEGRVQALDPTERSVVLDNGSKLWLPEDANLDALKEGVEVKAMFEERDGKNVITDIEVK